MRNVTWKGRKLAADCGVLREYLYAAVQSYHINCSLENMQASSHGLHAQVLYRYCKCNVPSTYDYLEQSDKDDGIVLCP